MINKNILLGLSSFFIPFFLFLRPSNLDYLDLLTVSQILIIQLIIFFLIIAIYYCIEKFFFRKLSFKYLPLISIIIYLNFLYYDIKNLIQDFEEVLSDKTLIIIILSISFISYIYLNKKSIIDKFLSFYIIFILFSTIFNFLNSSFFKDINYLNIFGEKIIMSKKAEVFENMYLIIFDELMDSEVYDKNYNSNTSKTINEIKKNYYHVKNSRSNYDTTTLSIGSFLNLNYIPIRQNTYEKQNVFPFNLWLKNYNEISLTNKLSSLGINFYFLSSSIMPCKERSFVKCNINSKGGNFNNLFRNLNLFYYATFYSDLNRKHFLKKEIRVPINQILKQKTFPKNNFYFIHNLLPHRPYNFNSNCKKTERNDGNYKLNYSCSLLLISKIINHLEKYDPNASVIITGDHGTSHHNLNKELSTYKLNEFVDPKILTLVKTQKCKSYPKENFDHNLSIFQYIFNCHYNTNIKLSQYKFFSIAPKKLIIQRN